VDVEGAIEVLEELGWKHEGDAMVLPANVSATMVQFRQVEEAREKLVREQRRKVGTQRTGTSKEQQRLREQLEADRRERMTELPVTRPSVAKPLEGGPKVRSRIGNVRTPTEGETFADLETMVYAVDHHRRRSGPEQKLLQLSAARGRKVRGTLERQIRLYILYSLLLCTWSACIRSIPRLSASLWSCL